jgi:signal transduction histidine kinase/CheY-like chemotaxis protein/HAMP domain-containing protein
MSKTFKEKFSEFFPGFKWSNLGNLGIGKTMLLWFLAITLIPLASLSFINYLYYYQGLNILSKKSLFTTSQLRVNDLNNYFEQADDYLAFLSDDKDHIRLFDSLDVALKLSSISREELVKSALYVSATRQLTTSLKKSWHLEGLTDILLINSEGIIVFALNERELTGSDLFAGELSQTLAAHTCKKILNTGTTLFSDLEHFPPGSNRITGLLGKTVFDQEGNKLGILAIQISTERIDRIIQYSTGFGSTARVYLVGIDLNLRSVSEYGSLAALLAQKEDNTKTRIWQASKLNLTETTPEGALITEEVTYYSNTRNEPVMGLFRDVDYLEKMGIHWALVEEINTDEAHAVARELSTFAKISLIVTAILVFIISIFVTQKFVSPIKAISAWAKQVALGELVSKDIRVAEDEVGEMKHTFNRLVSTLAQYADISQSIALGDYTKQVPIRSPKDILGISMNEMVESFKRVVKQAKAIASGDYSTNVTPRSDQDTLGISLFNMTNKLRETSLEIRNQDWLKTGLNELSQRISGERSIQELTDEVIIFLAHYLDSRIGLLFIKDDQDMLNFTAGFSCKPELKSFAMGTGVIGQVAKEKNSLDFSVPEENLPSVNIGPGASKPQYFIVAPILYEGELLGVIQLGSFHPFDQQKKLFLDRSLETIGVAINTARSREKVQHLLIKTQEQANKLVEQKEELRQINEELEEQTKALRQSEENLQHQQEELRVINEELEERTRVLELQRDDIRKKNQALQQAQDEIRQKAEALEVASRYKSEFLTNMSHELRTPLNSILALSELLGGNKNHTMTQEEIEFANVINSSGKDLLDLINDILDLSKVEAGKLEMEMEDLYLDDLVDYVKKTFSPLTNNKGISLVTSVDKEIPERIETDPQRTLQIIKNLLSNAIKFTQKGSVTLHIHRPGKAVRFTNPALTGSNSVAIDVIDTGVGIPEDKISVIFEAFQQADGTVSRKFGGTGLGLTISRSLTRLLGGEIHLTSRLGKGSTFTLYLPEKMPSASSESIAVPGTAAAESKEERKPAVLAAEEQPVAGIPRSARTEEPSPGDRKESKADKVFENRKILIVDDDMRNVFVLSKILEEKRVRIFVGKNGRDGIERLQQNPDTSLVIMDIMMPEMDGYEAMREIRKDKRFLKLPIIALTAKAMKGDREKCIEAGANDYLSKPVQTEKLLSLLRVWLQK